MVIENFTLIPSLVGGLLIGISSSILMLFNGRIAGISGITKEIFNKNNSTHEKTWRTLFITGIIIGGFVISIIMPEVTAKVANLNYIQMIIAGLLVGIGTALGNGCTSGHGICGLARRSPRSLASVLTFMATGFLTVYILFHILGLKG